MSPPTNAPVTNRARLRELLIDVLLLMPSEFHFELQWSAAPTWDSLSVVSLAVGIDEVFGYHLTPEEANSIKGVPDIVAILTAKGISFDE